jgi:hypothetical protein
MAATARSRRWRTPLERSRRETAATKITIHLLLLDHSDSLRWSVLSVASADGRDLIATLSPRAG